MIVITVKLSIHAKKGLIIKFVTEVMYTLRLRNALSGLKSALFSPESAFLRRRVYITSVTNFMIRPFFA